MREPKNNNNKTTTTNVGYHGTPLMVRHKSHIGQKKCFTSKYRENAYILYDGAYSLLWTFDIHKSIYFLKARSPKIPLVSRLKQMIQGVKIIQGRTLKWSCIFVNFHTLACHACSLIITMESKERHHLEWTLLGLTSSR